MNMTDKFGRLALHMWTIDTTPLATALDAAKQAGFDAVELRRTDFKRCFDAGMSNDQVLDLIKKSGIPVGVLGVEYGWLFATGDESKRLFDVFRSASIGAGRVSLAFALRFRATDRTLTDDEVAALRQGCIDAVTETHAAQLRS